MKSFLSTVAGVVFRALSAFFTYYSVHLLYINLFDPAVIAHRELGMYIGVVVFPLIALAFGWLTWKCCGPLPQTPQTPQSPDSPKPA